MGETQGSRGRGLRALRGRGEAFHALSFRDFRLLWLSQVGHSASMWVEQVARSWLIWELTGSATMLGLISLARAVPFFTTGILAGTIADRTDKRRLLIICKVVVLTENVVLATLITTGLVQIWWVFLAAVITGVAMSFEQPTKMALIPGLVKEKDLMNAVALNSIATNVTRIAGPGAAGLIIGFLGVGAAYFLSAGIYATSLICMILLTVPPVARMSGSSPFFENVWEGFRYCWQQKTILTILLMALVVMAFGMPYFTLMPVFASDVLGIGAEGYGILMSVSGLGAMVGAVALASAGRIRNPGVWILTGVFFFGFSLLAFALSPWLPLSLVLITIVGLVSTALMALINALLLALTPTELHGRVMAVYALDRGLMPLGSMAAGAMADISSAPFALAIMGGICILVSLGVGLWVPFVRNITHLSDKKLETSIGRKPM